MSALRDVFVCHASEEKPTVVRPLVAAFEDAGISFWYDEAEIKWGDSITEKVNEGLAVSRFVIVVLSATFVSKKWPQRELNAALSVEASSGEVRVLPLVVGTKQEARDILAAYPILNDKSYIQWKSNPQVVVDALRTRLTASHAVAGPRPAIGIQRNAQRDVPMPKLLVAITQRDKDRYLRSSFDVIKDYFNDAVNQLSHAAAHIEADVEEVHRYKFVCSFYAMGNLSNRCKIWLGGPMSSESIAYSEGHDVDYNSDSSCNDWLTIAVTEGGLGLKPSNMWFGASQFQDGQLLSPEQAAEYFWKRAIDQLR